MKELKIFTNDVIQYYKALQTFVEKDIETKAQVAWNIEDNLDKFEKIIKRIDKKRDELFSPLREKEAFEVLEDGRIRVKSGFEEEFLEADAKLNSFLDTVNTINIETITLKDLPDKITPKDLRALKFMIEKEQEDKNG